MPEKTFISYSRSDAEFALRLAKDLRAAKIDVWIDQLDICAGDMWDQAVEVALRESANVLVVLSPAAVGSRSVMDEVAFALEENKRVLPVRYRECAIPFRLRRVQFTDFTSGYDDGLRRLVNGLADPQPEPTETQAEPEDAERQPPTSNIEQEPHRAINTRLRWPWLSRHPTLGTAVLAGVGAGLAVTALLITDFALYPGFGRSWDFFPFWFVWGTGLCFLAGLIAGTRRAARIGGIAVAAATALSFAVLGPLGPDERFLSAFIVTGPPGAIVGAILGRMFGYVRQRRLRAAA